MTQETRPYKINDLRTVIENARVIGSSLITKDLLDSKESLASSSLKVKRPGGWPGLLGLYFYSSGFGEIVGHECRV